MRNPRKIFTPDGLATTTTTSTSSTTSMTQAAAAAAATMTMTTAEDHPNQHLTIVIKLGSSSIVNEDDFQPQVALLSSIVETVCNLRRRGHRVILVSSGAIAMGLKRMEMRKRPKILAEKQALAAIGQGRLIAMWDNLFSMLGQPIAQVLLTRSDISDRSRYLNSTKTLSALLSYGVVPIVNENDTVSVSEIKFGDNDTLSAITASMVGADYLFLLTDVDCLYTDNPRRFPDLAKPVRIVRDIESLREVVSTSTMGSNLGTGGMETKIIAAELATGAGVSTVITHGKRPASILAIVSAPMGDDISDEEYERSTPLHTVFLPEPNPLPDKRWWVVHGLKPRGRIIIDEGAYRAIARSAVHASSSSGTQTPSLSNPNSISTTAAAAASSTSSAHAPSSSSSSTTTTTSTPSTPSVPIPSPSILASSNSKETIPSSAARTSSSAPNSSSTGNGGRLLPAGVIAVEGTFAAGQAVTVVVQRKRRKGKAASSSATAAAPTSQSIRGRRGSFSRSGSSSLANSIVLEQAKQSISDATEAASSFGHAVANQLLQQKKEGNSSSTRRTTSDAEHLDSTTDDDEGDIEVEEQIEFGRGLANYNYQEIDKIKGHKSSEIEKILGYIESEHCVESITSLKRLEL